MTAVTKIKAGYIEHRGDEGGVLYKEVGTVIVKYLFEDAITPTSYYFTFHGSQKLAEIICLASSQMIIEGPPEIGYKFIFHFAERQYYYLIGYVTNTEHKTLHGIANRVDLHVDIIHEITCNKHFQTASLTKAIKLFNKLKELA